MFLLNCIAFLLGIANVVYSYFMFRRRYIFALNAMEAKDTTPNFGCNLFRNGLLTVGINLFLAIIGIVLSLCDGLPTEGQQKPFIDFVTVLFLFFLVCLALIFICRKKISNVNRAFEIPGSKERKECLSKMTMIASGFANLIVIAIFFSVFQATVIAYDFILCFL